MRLLISFLFCLILCCSSAQTNSFNQATEQFNLPNGILEAVSFSNTRFNHLDSTQRCSGLPVAYSIMGLIENGRGYFHSNLKLISAESGYSIQSIKSIPDSSIMAYAVSLSTRINATNTWTEIFSAIGELSELPDETLGQQFAKEAFLYQVFDFLSTKKHQTLFNFPDYQLNGFELFGNNFHLHSSKKIKLNTHLISNGEYDFIVSNFKNSTCNDYPNSLFISADASNYSGRAGTAISAITIHDIEGSYAGAISWFQNPSANVSAHYVLRSSDGQITQMVCEADKGWHVGTGNPYSIGFEHEGYASQQGWYTEEMYQASADLVRDICNSGYGINPLRTYNGPPCLGSSSSCEQGACIRIKGHQHYPSQSHTDPGIYWDWPYFYQLINEDTPIIEFNTETGTITDSGGDTGEYSEDERLLYLIETPAMASVTLNFEQLNIEENWDYIRIYQGNSVSNPMVRTYTGSTIPSDTTFETNALLIEFTSDCATNLTGYKINYSSTSSDTIAPSTFIQPISNFQTDNFQVNFTDTDNSGTLDHLFYNVSYLSPIRIANTDNGFYFSSFENLNGWNTEIGNWSVNNSTVQQSEESLNNSNIYTALNQNENDKFLYNYDFKFNGASGNRRAGLHFYCDSANYENRLNSYFVFAREEDDKFQVYKVTNDVFDLVQEIPFSFAENEWYNIKVLLSKTDSTITSFINDSVVSNWKDTLLHSTGNYISFRTGNAEISFRNLAVFHDRLSNQMITVGPELYNDIKEQSSISFPEVGFIQSIILDTNYNLSTVEQESYKIDWTQPQIGPLHDNNMQDEDTSFINSELSGYWAMSIDTNSNIDHYAYRIGTTMNPSQIQDWVNTNNLDFSLNSLNLDFDSTYHIQLVAINGAGLESQITSDGLLILDPLSIEEHTKVNLDIYPNPSSEIVHLSSEKQIQELTVINAKGKLVEQSSVNSNQHLLNIEHWTSGFYFIIIKIEGLNFIRKVIKE